MDIGNTTIITMMSLRESMYVQIRKTLDETVWYSLIYIKWFPTRWF